MIEEAIRQEEELKKAAERSEAAAEIEIARNDVEEQDENGWSKGRERRRKCWPPALIGRQGKLLTVVWHNRYSSKSGSKKWSVRGKGRTRLRRSLSSMRHSSRTGTGRDGQS